MSVQELEKKVQALPPDDLRRFARWFEEYRSRILGSVPDEQSLTAEQKQELERRIILAREHPELLEPWEGTVDSLREELDAYCAENRREPRVAQQRYKKAF